MTTVTDTFNRADNSSSLGTTSDGTATWAVTSPAVFGILSNQAYCVSNAGQQVPAYLDAGGSDGTITIDATTSTAHEYLVFRFTDANNYWMFGGGGHLYKFVGGTQTSVGSYSPTFTSRTLKVVLSASSISCFDSASGTSAVITATDSFNQTATKYGMVATATDARFDNFSATVSGSTVVPLTGDVKQEHVLAGTLTVQVVDHLTGAISAEQVLAASLHVATPISAWSTEDLERTDLPFELSGLLTVDPAEDPPPATDPYIQRVSITMPTPTLVDGRPQQPWTPSISRSDWGRPQLVIAGVDRSRPRGIGFIPLTDAHTDPFGDAEASFAFPGLTEYDDPADWGLTALAPVTFRRKDPGGTFHTLYEGEIASVEPDEGQGLGVVIQCVGVLYRLDLLKEPPRLLTTAHDYGDLIASALNEKRSRYSTNTGYCRHVATGVQGVRNADFQPLITGTIQDYLAELQTAGSAYTLQVARPRTPRIVLRDTTTVHATVSYGAPGVIVRLSKDYTTATTAVYGSGSNGHCTWMGARFPNLHQGSAPAFPLSVGAVFNPGSATTGFADFAAYLRSGHYGTIVSDDTYDAADEDNVMLFQDRAGITVDGVVGAQTWEAAFQPGANQGSMAGAYVDTIYEKSQTRRRLYNGQGADIGPNPAFDPTVPRIEDYIPFGDNVSKNLGQKSAKQIVSRSYPAGRTGTITLESDPTEMSRLDIDAGMNIAVENYNGGTVLVHVIRRERNWQDPKLPVTLTVDEKARDLLTAASTHQRNKDVSDLTRRQRFGRARSKVFNDYGTWLCEDGAGHIPLMNQQGGFWNIQRIAAAPKGSIERISLALGSGLTQHLINQAVSDTPPTSIPGAARGCIALFTQPVSANALGNLTGMGTPLTDLGDGTSPWDHNNTALVNTYGMIYAAGGPGQAIGFYPNNDPGDGSDTFLSGLFEDGGSIDFGPTGHYWLWLAVWTPVSCKIGGRVFPGPPS